MAVSSQPDHSPASRKMWRLAIVILAGIALYTGAWFYGARQLKTRLVAFMQQQEAHGLTLECGGIEIRGYPFRFEVFCTRPAVADAANGGSLNAVALRTAAQVYAPWHIVWEMDGPLDVTLGNGPAVQASWKSLQSSLQLKLGGLDRASLVADGLSLTLPAASDASTGMTATAGHGEAHIRQNGADLDAASLFGDVALTLPGIFGAASPPTLPVFSTSIDLTLAKKAGALDGHITGPAILHPANGELRRLVADFGAGRVATLSGPFSIDEQGLISGRLALEAENFTAWQPMIAAAAPDSAANINTAMTAMKGLADARGTVRVNLVIDRGEVLLGFIPLGIELPPV
nr:DUF2125 domain-containing protein [uncultured Gellertiella sp.]